MPQTFIHRVLTRQFLGANTLSDLLSAVYEATASNNPGSKIFVQDLSGNMTSFLYAGTSSLTGGLAVGVPVYFTTKAKTTVTDDPTAALTYVASSHAAIQSAAGVALNASLSTTYPYGWFQCGGYYATLPVVTVTKGDMLVLSNAAATSPTADSWTRIAVGTAASTPETVSTLYCVAVAAATTTATVMVMGTVGLP
jgi:hypothetical protein